MCPAELYPDLTFATVYYNCVLLSQLKINVLYASKVSYPILTLLLERPGFGAVLKNMVY